MLEGEEYATREDMERLKALIKSMNGETSVAVDWERLWIGLVRTVRLMFGLRTWGDAASKTHRE